MATMRGVLSNRSRNITKFTYTVRGNNHLHDNFTLVEDDFKSNNQFQHYTSKFDGRAYSIRRLKVDGRRPALECRGTIAQAVLESVLLTERHHESILQYRMDMSWMVIPERTPLGDTVDFCEQGADFPMSRVWSLVGMELYLVFDADVMQETLTSIIQRSFRLRDPKLMPDMNCSKKAMVQITSAVDHLERMGYTSSNGFRLDNVHCNNLQEFVDFPLVALGGFNIANIASVNDNYEKTAICYLGHMYFRFLFSVMNGICLTTYQHNRLERLVAANALQELRRYLRELLPIDQFLPELIVQCIQLEPEHRPSKRVICKILNDDPEYSEVCGTAFELGQMIGNGLYQYEELIFKPSYVDLFLDKVFLSKVSSKDRLNFQRFVQYDFPLLQIWKSYRRPEISRFVSHLRSS